MTALLNNSSSMLAVQALEDCDIIEINHTKFREGVRYEFEWKVSNQQECDK